MNDEYRQYQQDSDEKPTNWVKITAYATVAVAVLYLLWCFIEDKSVGTMPFSDCDFGFTGFTCDGFQEDMGDMPMVTYYYMDGCPYCTMFNPVWQRLLASPLNGEIVRMMSIEKSSVGSVPDANIYNRFPTIEFKFKQYVKTFDGTRDQQSILNWIDANLKEINNPTVVPPASTTVTTTPNYPPSVAVLAQKETFGNGKSFLSAFGSKKAPPKKAPLVPAKTPAQIAADARRKRLAGLTPGHMTRKQFSKIQPRRKQHQPSKKNHKSKH